MNEDLSELLLTVRDVVRVVVKRSLNFCVIVSIILQLNFTSVLCIPCWNMLVLFGVLTLPRTSNSLESVQYPLGTQQEVECHISLLE